MKKLIKISSVVKSFFLTLYYLIKSFFSKETLANGNKEVIVSMTSYGKRLNYVFLTIESILSQKYKPSKIILWLYKDDIPKGFYKRLLNRQQKRGLLIKYVDVDVRSFKKLSFILDGNYISVNPAVKYIVTADDDIFYPSNWLDGFQHQYKRDISPAVLCYRARNIIIGKDNLIRPYNKWGLANNETVNKYHILPTGVSGICYPIQSLDESIQLFDEIAQRCPYADDIWYKMVTFKNGYHSHLIVNDSIHYVPVFTGFAKGLEKMNVLEQRNDVQLKSSMDYFNITVDDLKK